MENLNDYKELLLNLQTAKEIERELAKKALCYWLPSDWKNALLIHEIFGLKNHFRFDLEIEMGGE